MSRIQKEIRKPAPFIGLQPSIFIVLVALTCIERIVSGFSITVDVSCIDQRTLMFGATDSALGIHDVLIIISLTALVVVLLDEVVSRLLRTADAGGKALLPIVNTGLALMMLALCAVPWAYYNIGHPVSDKIYDVQNAMNLSLPFVEPEGIYYERQLNRAIWECEDKTCIVPHTGSEMLYTHRELGLSFRRMLVADCMSPEFNRATSAALGQNIEDFSGVRRRYVDIWFDEADRFIGPDYRWAKTPLLVSQLTPAQLEPSDWSFDDLLDALVASDARRERKRARISPKWVSWDEASNLLRSGQVKQAISSDELLFGLELDDGIAVIGTTPQQNMLRDEIDACGETCVDIHTRIRH